MNVAVLGTERRSQGLQHAVLAVVAFVPLLLTRPDRIAADTRQYFYVDPSSFLARALNLWDPHAHLGTVEHSNVGLVFPMGSFYALTHAVGMPAWVAQRLWMGLLLFAAGAGVLFFARSLGWRTTGVFVAALAYALTPYTLQYATRTSVLLLPYAALPWMLGLTDRALRTRGWRHPAALALVAVTASGANVSAFALVALGPVIWLGYRLVTDETTWRQAATFVGRTVVLTVGTCALWVVALITEAHYGLNLLSYTETQQQVSTTSTAPEVLRGLGYWLFYGTEARRPNVSAATQYLTSPGVLVASYLLPGLALVAALLVRWRYRAVCLALVVVGVVVGVGAYPYQDPSIVGRGFKALTGGSSIGLALRSSSRAVPLSVLGLALLLGAGVDALWNRRAALGLAAGVVVVALVLVDAPALFTGNFVDPNFSRPTTVPAAWRQAAAALDRAGGATRVLQIPGQDFAAYRWGITYDTSILPTLLRRPSASREEIPYGSAASADLLAALDETMANGVFEPQTLAPLARLLASGDVLVASDLQFERYGSPRPELLWAQLHPTPPGLGPPVAYGPPTPNVPSIPVVDAQALGTPTNASQPPPVAVFPVQAAPAILHSAPSSRPTIIDGDGTGIVNAAAAGLVNGQNLILYGASLATQPAARRQALGGGGDIVVTDTNRRRERRWRSTAHTTGLTDRAGHSQPSTQGEATLDEFPGTGDATRTVTVPQGATVDATAYGDPVTFNPEQRAAASLDGDPSTAWQIDGIADPAGAELTIHADRPVTTDHLTLLQAQGPDQNRFVRDVTLQFDQRPPIAVHLDAGSRSAPGQTVTFPRQSFSTVKLRVTATETSPDAARRGVSGTGFAEITIPGLRFHELVRLPTDLTSTLGTSSLGHRLSYVFTRLRSNPADTTHGDEETSLQRSFQVPAGRSFSLTGAARLSSLAPEPTVDAVLGAPSAADGGVTVTSSGQLPGALDQRARAALDGDPSTAWTTPIDQQVGAWIQASLPAPITLDHLNLAVVADGRHSVPTQLRLDTSTESRTVDLPPIADSATPGAVRSVPVHFAPITGSTFRVTITAAREVDSPDPASGLPQPLPASIAELGIPGVVAPPPPASLPGTCRSDLLTVDGTPVPVRVDGTTADAAAGGALSVQSCNGPITLGPGQHVLGTAAGSAAGVDLDRLTLSSQPGGAALPVTSAADPTPPAAPAASPTVRVLSTSSTSARVRVAASGQPFWLVLGQSLSDGWHADVAGGPSLGTPKLVNGYANAWYVPAGGAREIDLTWTPVHTLHIALVLAILAVLGCALLVWRGRRWLAPPAAETESRARAAVRGSNDGAGIRRWQTVAALSAVATLAVFLVAGLPAGLGAGVAIAVALAWRHGRVALAVVALALLVAAFGGIVRTQRHEARPVSYGWTNGEETESTLALTGLLLVGADPLVAAARRRAGSAAGSEKADE